MSVNLDSVPCTVQTKGMVGTVNNEAQRFAEDEME
jgi:hypothetical protein